ncbi:general stress protein [Amycolatopsis sp. DSM 110486]|uniref:general stress protein n=1 Tax=Amycolatopsis sp. DSM 110486 TaxID=2865832 RepID=UPI001C697CCF|nr:general stress protein [Amycolatopsis sp. DSM 110486]QYN19054.1 glycine zipper family protein [Amycolatopsis sp. DSM 110486]
MTAQPGAAAPSPRHSSDQQASEKLTSEQRAAGQRRPIGAYETYSEAERAVDYLSDNGFPVQRVAIIGSDVKLVEQVVGRLNYGGAALRGAGSGAVTGLLIGWLFGTFNWFTPLLAAFTLAVYGLLFGAVIGAIFGLVIHALQRGRRDFASVRVMTPTRYEVVADEAVADDAKNLLAKMKGSV